MTEKAILFISDLHLEEDRADISQAFFEFLRTYASKAQAFYILGDFFNVWLGDDHSTELSNQVATQLSELANKGVRVSLLHGNRDFLLGEDYAARCSARLIHEPYLLEAFDHKILLMHGDILCTKDTDYMAFRKLVRNPDWQQAFLAKPVTERLAFAAEARQQSKVQSSNKAEDIMDVTKAAVVETMKQHQVKTLIHGHTHRPAVHSLTIDGQQAERYVLGDWDKQLWFIQLDKQGLELKQLKF